MEVFEILLKDLKQYEIKNFSPWLYSVTKNHCLKKKRGATLHMIGDDNIEKYDKNFMEFDPGLSLTDETEKEEKISNIEKAVKSLSEEQKQCIELFYLQEKSYKEVADETGYSMNKVKSYIQNGKRNLKGILNIASWLIICITKSFLQAIAFPWMN